jgi:hypothetical protein
VHQEGLRLPPIRICARASSIATCSRSSRTAACRKAHRRLQVWLRSMASAGCGTDTVDTIGGSGGAERRCAPYRRHSDGSYRFQTLMDSAASAMRP